MRPIRAALIGAGYWGSNLIRNLVALNGDGADLRWICDRDPARLDDARMLAPAPRLTTSIDEVLADDEIDAVLVAIHPPQHPDVAVRVLEAGKHLFLEKPMALTVDEARRVATAAERADRVLMIGLTYRYNALVEESKRLLDTGALGTLRACFSQRSDLTLSNQHTNVLWSLAPHDVSILQHLLGHDPAWVETHGSRSAPERVTDSAWVRMRFAGDVEARFFLSWAEPPKSRRLILFGSERTLVLDEMVERQDRLRLYPAADVDAAFPWTGGAGTFVVPSAPAGAEAERVPIAPGTPEPLRAECRHFFDCVRTGRVPRTGRREGLDVTRWLARMQRSLDENGARVEGG